MQNNLQNNNKAQVGTLPLVFLVSLFFIWGVLNNLNDVLIAQFRSAFTLNDLQSGLVQSAFYIGYFVFAVPASLLMSRFSYKVAIICGLILVCLGAFLFDPAASSLLYSSFLIALFVLAAGCSFLEASANPYIAVLGNENSTRYLNFAQSFNALGAIIAVLVGKYFILNKTEVITPSEAATMNASQLKVLHTHAIDQVVYPYMGIAVVVAIVGLLIFCTKYPKVKTAGAMTFRGYVRSILSLSEKGHFTRGVLGQFLYVGAQTCVWSFTIRYCMYSQHMTPSHAANYLLASLVAFACGRFFSTAIMKYVTPHKLMGVYAILNTLLCLYMVLFSGMSAVWALVLTSFFMSMMYPTIFTMSISSLGENVPYASSLLVMGILGGAVITAVMGVVSDASNIAHAFIIPTICFVYIFGYSFWGSQPLAKNN